MDDSGDPATGSTAATAPTTPGVRSPQQRRLAALTASDDPRWYRTLCRVRVPEGLDPARTRAAAEPVLRDLVAGTGAPVPEPVLVAEEPAVGGPHPSPPGARLSVAEGTLTLRLPAAWADETTVLAVLRELLGVDAGPGADILPYPAAARWWEELTRAESGAQIRQFWRARAAGWQPPLPALGGPVGPGGFSVRGCPVTVPADLTARLRAQEVAPVPAWLLAAWQLLLRRRTGLVGLLVGVATDLRRHDELHGCRGPLTAYLPVAAETPLAAPLAAHARLAADQLAEAARCAPWFDWEQALPDPTSAAEGFGFGFGYQVLPGSWHTPAGAAQVRDLDTRCDRFALRLRCRDGEDGLALRLEYDPRLVSAELAADLAAGVPEVLAEGLPHHVGACSTGAAQEDSYRAPRNQTEQVLAEVWAAALGLERVGVDDNFYELGGDSILSILVASRAAKRGLKVSLRHFFEHQTIAAMAPHVSPVGEESEPRPVARGLTPVQHWFFAQPLPHRGHWNQGWLLTVPDEPDVGALAAAVAAVVRHHPALGSRFHPDPAAPGGWRPERAAQSQPGDQSLVLQWTTGSFRRISVPAESWSTGLASALAELQEVDVSTGPLLRVALLDGGSADRRRLALVAHHLVVDTVSWQIILEDLRTAYQQICHGAPIELPATTMPPDEWGAALAAAADTVAPDLDYWLDQSPPDLPELPVDHAAEPSREQDRRMLEVALDAERTQQLLRRMSANTRVDYALTTAVALAVADWTGNPFLHVTVEGQGRAHDLVPGAELYRSVGWFTALAPLLVRLPGTDPLRALRSVREQIHAMPHEGLSYGVLRYLDPVRGPRLAARPAPQISVNYTGHTGGSAAGSGTPVGLRLGPAPEPLPPLLHPSGVRDRLWDINAVVGGDQLYLLVDYAGRQYRPGTARWLADRIVSHLGALVDAWVDSGGLPLAPDFPGVGGDERAWTAAVTRAMARAPAAGRRGPGARGA